MTVPDTTGYSSPLADRYASRAMLTLWGPATRYGLWRRLWVALAESEKDVLERLNELLALARPRPYATDHDGELHLHYARADAPVLEQLTTTVAMGLSQVVVQHGWQRLGVCAAEDCDNVYVDTSRNASRRYCSNTCASRSTVAAYRARQKA